MNSPQSSRSPDAHKTPGGIVFGVDKHGADTRDIRRLQNAAHGICDQSGP